MTRPSVHLVTMPIAHYHPVMSPSHVAKQQMLHCALLTSHRNYSNEKQYDASRSEYFTYIDYECCAWVSICCGL